MDLRGRSRYGSHSLLAAAYIRDLGHQQLMPVQDAQELDRMNHSSTEANTRCSNGMRHKEMKHGRSTGYQKTDIRKEHIPNSSPFSLLKLLSPLSVKLTTLWGQVRKIEKKYVKNCLGSTYSRWKFLGRGLNPRHSSDLRHSSNHAGSLPLGHKRTLEIC